MRTLRTLAPGLLLNWPAHPSEQSGLLKKGKKGVSVMVAILMVLTLILFIVAELVVQRVHARRVQSRVTAGPAPADGNLVTCPLYVVNETKLR